MAAACTWAKDRFPTIAELLGRDDDAEPDETLDGATEDEQDEAFDMLWRMSDVKPSSTKH